ncbi:MAG: hypothetical protein P4M01_08115 [Acidobacteriota bacterium]|nr:hypothetical protein [Acidobacteriota bacterium]
MALSALPVFAADPSTQKLTPSSQKLGVNQDVKPFSSVAVGVIVGTLGPGVEVATPLSRRLNLRGDAGFFNYNTSVSDSGINYNGGLKLRNGRISLDYFPWAKGFHISPGVLIYNQLDINATAIFSSTSSFTLNDVDYYSSVDKPLTGAATVEFGHKVAPALTVGWGNAIPRTGRHLSFGAEIGVAYTGTPNFNLNVTGYACNQAGQASSSAYCYNVADTTNANATDFNTNLNAQKKKITDDLNYVKAYPILNLAVTYRF